jgi:hypothetical protein
MPHASHFVVTGVGLFLGLPLVLPRANLVTDHIAEAFQIIVENVEATKVNCCYDLKL